ncbi:MAG: OB-fold domain-containing protein [Dehalococcoidia bacterium]
MVGGVYFASTSPPYQRKQSASILATAADLGQEIFTADFTDSVRAGTSALRAALDAVKAGSARQVLVVASDRCIPAPASEQEMTFGDGAAALLIGEDDVAVSIAGSYTITSEFMDLWKRDREDTYYRTWEDRFITTHGYTELTQKAVSGLMKKYELGAKDFTRAVFYGPDPRSHAGLARSLGFDAKTQVADPLFTTVGNTGAALSLMMLIGALEEAKPGDRILLANYGDGADAYILEVQEGIEKLRGKRGIKKHLASRLPMPNYEKYLRFRRLVEFEPERRPPDQSALTVLWRESSQVLRFHGGKCRECGTIQFPIQRVCGVCRSREYEEVPLADKKGTLFTYSLDERAMVMELPNVMSIVDFDGGGRFYCTLTDRDPDQVEVGMRVEMTFRNMHEGAGIYNYYWKARPLRC